MSVFTGAFVLADAGLLSGKHVPHTTTHWQISKRPRNKCGIRYVPGGLISGIDLALHIVELHFGRESAQATAQMMEYEGHGLEAKTVRR